LPTDRLRTAGLINAPNTTGNHVITPARRYELLVQAVSDYAIYLLDEHGFVTSWNIGAERLKGYSPQEIIGQHFSRFFTREDQVSRVPERNLAQALADGRYETEGWLVRKDGSRFWAAATLQQVRDESGRLIGLAKITRDMTERVAAQAALLESERRFRLLVEGVIDYAIYMLDPSGVVTNWNTGAERLKGYTPEEIVGQHFSKFYTKEDRANGLPARVLETAAREGRFEAEGWRVRKDGSRFFASVVVDAIRSPTGRLEGFAKVTRDITERRAAQDALRDSERQFRMLIGSLHDFAVYMLDPNGIVTSWNAGAERIKGYTSEEIVGQHFSRFYTERDRAAGVPSRALYTAGVDGGFEAEGWRVRKDGSIFWANVVINAIRDERKTLLGFAKITRDITERRNAQIALQEAQRQLAHSQKMDALGHLTGGVAHDFNNLLMVISGHLPTLKKAVAENLGAARALEAIELAARRGESLTRQLLTFARRQTVRPKVISLADRVEVVRTLLARSLGGGVSLTVMAPADLWRVKVDESEFELAILNVALNARDAMPEGGIITITAENVQLAEADTGANLTGDFVALHVADTGSGIAPDVLPKVFDPFFSTKTGSGKGSGLGLSQVHGFVHQSGGTVTVDTEIGKGTVITLYLPRSDEVLDGSIPESPVESERGGSILVVEDNPDVAEVTASMLRELGYDVQLAGDGASARAKIEISEFDLVISDIVMANPTDGISLARQLRTQRPDLPVLLVTGYTKSAVEASSEFSILRKPFQIAELSRLVARKIAEAKQPQDTNLVRLRDRRPVRKQP
jgi:PAS domain S-box-containing protein